MRFRHLAVVAALALVNAACAGDDAETALETDPSTKVSMALVSPQDGDHIAGNVATIELDITGIEIVKADGDTSRKTGHLHVFIDQEPVAEGEVIGKGPGIVHSAENPVVVPGLSKGEHTMHVVLGDGTHTRMMFPELTFKMTVDGPSIDATAPAELASGAPLTIAVAVDGFELVKADGAMTETTGHLHAFVDTPPLAPGEPIPVGNPLIIHSATSPISVTGLAPGEHTIWIVAGDGTHHAFKMPVRDKVVVTVT